MFEKKKNDENKIQATKLECGSVKTAENHFVFLHKQIREIKKKQVNSQNYPLEIMWTK